MRDWMDLNGDGKIDGAEMMFAGEMLCTSREEHEARNTASCSGRSVTSESD